MTTTRIYFSGSYLTEFTAHVIERADEGRRIYLDRTAFYPASGGQPNDLGDISGANVVDVIDEGARIAHITSSAVDGLEVECRVDWPRRFDHMQQHSGQHLLSAVLFERLGLETVGFHLGAAASTIDLAAASLDAKEVAAIEAAVNERVMENRPVTVVFEEASEARDLRRASDREGTLRIVCIEGLDRSACGGTHVRATGEIGPVLIRKLEKIRGDLRLEFLCGLRALRRARADFEALSRIAKIFSAPLDDTAALVASQREAFQEADKSRRKISAELARYRGREMYQTTAPGADGLRRALHRQASGSLDDEVRGLAQGFTAQAKALFVAAVDNPPAVLLAVSADAGLNAGQTLKAALSTFGGRGGGSALLAQGSVPAADQVEPLCRVLAQAV